MAKPADRSEGEKEFMFNHKDFDRVRGLIYQRAGISLSDSKQEMVYSRLARRLRATGLNSFSTYLDMLERESNSGEWEAFTNALTTNLTSFFREEHHFPILAEHIKKKNGHLRVWCSASSTGEEPYSIAICICEALGTIKPNLEIIATDIDTNVLAVAARGVYNADRIEKLPNDIVRKYFLRGRGKNEGSVLVRPELRNLISFESLNLLEDRWSLSGEFDAIFCRNVMIYFDKPTQSSILKKFVPLLKSDGLLFAGHSENFLYVSDDFKLRGKTVYVLASQEDKRKKSNSYDLNKG
ncbi:CheR family methyltransferase [Undibacterium flavidum]|uniref:Chemotaxis protein methyltransferase n=1 Tax=Undibacterium flavidum TaxID=2762297 RepID=A0ABR6YEN3_9BURK|nr:CheR family methyltransferase [Undibacterium flavidum]MBC3874983.1 chemotaxis protein CheR [Undibacterium flavidum]